MSPKLVNTPEQPSPKGLDGADCSPLLRDALEWAASDGSNKELARRLSIAGRWSGAGDNALEIVAKAYNDMIQILKDPVAVHINMLRGTIAWTPEHMRHILGDSNDNYSRDAQRLDALESQSCWIGLKEGSWGTSAKWAAGGDFVDSVRKVADLILENSFITRPVALHGENRTVE